MFQIELDFGIRSVGFEERGKPEYPEENLSEQGREPTVELMSLLSYVNDSRKDLVKSRRL